jgi:hypothetical protein
MWCLKEHDLVSQIRLVESVEKANDRLIICRAFKGLGGGTIIGMS